MSSGAAVANVFINYRREETAGMAGRIYDRLVDEFSAEKVFMDVDAMKPGIDFAQQLEDQVSRCSIVLAVIGPRWCDARNENGERRLENDQDWVRTELAAALKRNIPVVPVLVDGAIMPHPSQLPEELKPLTRRHAIEIRNTKFRADADAVVKAIVDTTGNRGRSHTRSKIANGATLAFATGLVAAVAYLFIVGPPVAKDFAPVIAAANKLVREQTEAAAEAEKRRTEAEIAARAAVAEAEKRKIEAEIAARTAAAEALKRQEVMLEARLKEERARTEAQSVESSRTAAAAAMPAQEQLAPEQQFSSVVPSFNCIENTGVAEQTICHNTGLARLDVSLSQIYFTLKGRMTSSQGVWLRNSQRAWLKQRDSCRSDVACIEAAYRTRIGELQQFGG